MISLFLHRIFGSKIRRAMIGVFAIPTITLAAQTCPESERHSDYTQIISDYCVGASVEREVVYTKMHNKREIVQTTPTEFEWRRWVYRCVRTQEILYTEDPGQAIDAICALFTPALTLMHTEQQETRDQHGQNTVPSSSKKTQAIQSDPLLSIDKQTELQLLREKLQQLERLYQGGQPERLGSEKNYQKYLDRVTQIEQQIAQVRAQIKLRLSQP